MNVNGIKRNSHPLVEHHLHKIDIACIQETKFRDVAHRENFEHSVLSKYAAKTSQFASCRASRTEVFRAKKLKPSRQLDDESSFDFNPNP